MSLSWQKWPKLVLSIRHIIFSFELGKIWAQDHSLHQDGDEYFISDRLSFFQRRENEEIISVESFESEYEAILIIDTQKQA